MDHEVIKPGDKQLTSEPSIEAKLLYERLIQCRAGDTISYTDLTTIAGRDVCQRARGALMTARRMAERQDRLVFGVIRAFGLQCLSDKEIVGAQQAKLDHVRRTARRSARQLTCVRDYAQLPREEQIRHNAYQSINAAIAFTTRAAQIKRIENRVADLGRVLPLGQLLDELRK